MLRDGVQCHLATVRAGQLTVGRAPTNDLCFPDAGVSWQHALVWVQDGEVWVKDLGSRNGTFVNGARVQVPQVVRPGDRLRLGSTLEVRTRPLVHAAEAPPLVVEELGANVLRPVRGDRFVFGTGAGADVVLGSATVTAVLQVLGPEELVLGMEAVERPLVLGQKFALGPRAFRVLAAGGAHPATVDAAPDRFPYEVEARGSGDDLEVALHDPDRGLRHRVEPGPRALLLLRLGQGSQVGDGWVGDEEVAEAIWGDTPRETNAVNVVLFRLRKELGEAGFDPWFLEKRRRGLRARLRRFVQRAR